MADIPRLNFMYTVAAVFTNMAALPVGTVLDRFGPRVCGIMGASFISIGCIVFSYAWDLAKKNIDGYIIGYLLLALGGPFIFISSFQLSNAFPRYSGLILALLTGAFDTSSAVFLFYRLIYQATNGKFSPKWFFLVYLVVPLFIFTVQFFLMPPSSYKTVGELVFQAEEVNDELIVSDHEDAAEEDGLLAVRRMESRERRESVIAEITQLIGSRDAAKQARHEEATRHVSGVWGAMHGKTATQQVRSAWFVLITLFTVVQMTRINYFVATVRSQYEFLLGSHQDAVAVNNFFDIALPLGGVMSIPFIGYILDNNSTVLVLSVLVFNATLIGILGIIPKIWAAYASICLFVIYRPFYYTCVSYVQIILSFLSSDAI
jgi:MFS family permease